MPKLIVCEGSSNLSRIIYEFRCERKLSQRELAKLIGCDHTYISKIENATTDYEPSVRFLAQLADLIGCDVEWLLFQCGRIPARYQGILSELAIKHGDHLPGLLRSLLEVEP